jgi:hypothetical protein
LSRLLAYGGPGPGLLLALGRPGARLRFGSATVTLARRSGARAVARDAPRRDAASPRLAVRSQARWAAAPQVVSGTCANRWSQYVPTGNAAASPPIQRSRAARYAARSSRLRSSASIRAHWLRAATVGRRERRGSRLAGESRQDWRKMARRPRTPAPVCRRSTAAAASTATTCCWRTSMPRAAVADSVAADRRDQRRPRRIVHDATRVEAVRGLEGLDRELRAFIEALTRGGVAARGLAPRGSARAGATR